MKNTNDFLLTKDVTVGDLKQWMSDKDESSKGKIIKLIQHRFTNRYVKHAKLINSGYLKMAVSCLMIETLESFKQGKKNAKGNGVGLRMFKDFFETEQAFFPDFNNIHADFYSNIRCGILHQAETTNAWRILRSDALLDKGNKTINASKFVLALEKSLHNYLSCLKTNDFETQVWKNALLKLEDICENCKSSHN